MPDREDDWVETLTRWAATLGFSPVRVRWKLRRLENQLQRVRRRTEQQVEHVRYEHRVCPNCTSVQDRDAKVCTRCGQPLGLRATEVARRMGFAPSGVSLSVGLGVVICLAYARLMLAAPELGFRALFTMDSMVLHQHGAFYPRAFWQGEWWRIVTALFLHIGAWHATFNLLALASIGPHVEEMYGRGKTLFIFLLTGVAANLVSAAFNPGGNAGASGALMGLIGLAAARGHRSGTSQGKAVRNLMFKWFLYTMAFGLMLGADNHAHGAGFVAGGLIGLVVSPRWFVRGPGKQVGTALSVVAIAVTALAFTFVIWPQATAFF